MQKKKEGRRLPHLKSADAVQQWFRRRFACPRHPQRGAPCSIDEAALLELWGKVAGSQWRDRARSVSYQSGRFIVHLYASTLGEGERLQGMPSTWVARLQSYLPGVRAVSFREDV